jgi:putative glutamine amidotransferase
MRVRPPVIAITVPRCQSAAFREYGRRIEEAGGVVREVAPDQAPSTAIDGADGLLLPGGGDVDPSRYGEAAHPESNGINRELDALEIEMFCLARDRTLPVLAICRGHQLVNVDLGGKLHQHIHGDAHRSIPSDAPSWEWPSRWHNVQIHPESRLSTVLGQTSVEVNSRHHQAVRPQDLAPYLRPVALSSDGYVEASEPNDASWLLSVQWHPEREEVIAQFRPLFAAFIDAATERMVGIPAPAHSPVLR